MTHDPMCPAHGNCVCNPEDLILPDWPGEESHDMGCPIDSPCHCDLIATVRAHEQQQVASRLTDYHREGCIGGTSGLGCGCGLWTKVITNWVELS